MNNNSNRHFPNVLKQPGLLFFVFTVCFVFWQLDLWRAYNAQKNHSNFVWDMYGYYSYLPGLFLNNGSFEFAEGVMNFNAHNALGILMPKYTYGVALLQLPAFLLAWCIDSLNGEPQSIGFDGNYVLFNEMAAIAYALLGLFLIRKVLLRYFDDFVIALTMMVCLFGTMLFMYTFSQSAMSHSYLFFLIAVFIYCTQRFYLTFKSVWLFGVALSGGLIVLIRPVEVYVYLMFLLWEVKSFAQLQTRAMLLLAKWKSMVMLVITAVLFWIPQFIFWRHFTGTYLYDSYPDEFFYWSDPQIFNVLLSYRKGWLVYTPAVLLSFIGFAFVGKKTPLGGWTLFGITALTVYVFSCWWAWDYGGCFGAREFSHQIAYLSFPMAALVDKVIARSSVFLMKRLATLLLFVFSFSCVFLNMGQSYQYQNQRKIQPSEMGKDLYWSLFRTFQYSKYFEKREFWQQLNKANVDQWRKGLERDDKPLNKK